jgi:hypothetical protein
VPSFSAIVDLRTVNGSNGFEMPGYNGNFANSIASAGDINHDGVDDFIVTASSENFPRGKVYVVFGRADGTFPADLMLADLNSGYAHGAQGFLLTGGADFDFSGTAVSAAGDINGDGIDDLLVTSQSHRSIVTNGGAVDIIFGRDYTAGEQFPLTVTLNATGDHGYRIAGTIANAQFGYDVAGIGDFNADGFQDFAFSALGVELAGVSYIVFGRADLGVGDMVDLDTESLATNGIRLTGVAKEDFALTLAAAGDVNNDGYDDLLIAAPGSDATAVNAGATYVIYGRADGAGLDISLSAINGTNGFRVTGVSGAFGSATAISGAGDVNGDGVDDFIIGAAVADPNGVNGAGSAYVVFGRDSTSGSAFPASFSLSSIDGANGFRIDGAAALNRLGWSVSSADLNGDGRSDIIVAADSGDPTSRTNAGKVYVIFGKDTASDGAFDTAFSVSSLDGTNGFEIWGGLTSEAIGRTLQGLGDINGDGVDDVLIGAPGRLVNSNTVGGAYVLFGRQADLTRTGGALGERLDGASANDILRGLGGRDTLYGLAGDDALDGGDLGDLLYGGDGADNLIGGAGGDILYGDDGDDVADGGLGGDKLFGGDGADILTGGDGNDRLVGDAGDDELIGGAGADQLDGAAGVDRMVGGLGNDIYIVRAADDTVVESANEGFDIVRSTVSHTLAADVEALELLGGAINGTGNALANRLTGSAGANTLDGRDGADVLIGGGGNDILIGGTGRDQLFGGAGADSFTVLVESLQGPTLEIDEIGDFSRADGDRLSLAGIDANAALAGDQAFTVVAGFSKAAGQLFMFYAAAQDVTTLRLDLDGDGRADYQLRLNGDLTGSTDWLLL